MPPSLRVEAFQKGTSFEFLTQWDVNPMVNHINPTPRKSLNGSTPYDIAAETYGEDVLKNYSLGALTLMKSNSRLS
jgi:hypothetical protein